MVSVVYNDTNITIFRLPFNKTYEQVFSLPHRPNLETIQNLIDFFNRTARKIACPPAIQTNTTTMIAVNKNHLYLIVLIMALLIVLLFLVIQLLGSFKRRSYPSSMKRFDSITESNFYSPRLQEQQRLS